MQYSNAAALTQNDVVLLQPIPCPPRGPSIHDATCANGALHLILATRRERYENRRDPTPTNHIRAWQPEERGGPT